jgi:hypothetical protein
MARARSLENGAHGIGNGGAASAAPPANPLTIVEAAVAGDDLTGVARSAAGALSCGVAIALPAFGPPAQWPKDTPEETLRIVLDYAGRLVAERAAALPPELSDAVPVRLGRQVVGVVAALAPAGGAAAAGGAPGNGHAQAEQHAWLEAAAAAAAVTALMRESGESDPLSGRRAFLQMLELHGSADAETLLAGAGRLGHDLSHGAVAICALLDPQRPMPEGLLESEALIAEVSAGRLLALVPLGADGGEAMAAALLERLQDDGARAVASAPRRDPGALPEALREAGVLLELELDSRALLRAQEDTYRLLTGVLLHTAEELTQLRTSTIAGLEQYDSDHDTELLRTLEAFLQHHGSTTETAEAMSLHRHTVGYRLARVQEVSGLSPYESDGRERLSLGLKADRILLADNRRLERSRPG